LRGDRREHRRRVVWREVARSKSSHSSVVSGGSSEANAATSADLPMPPMPVSDSGLVANQSRR
jgi:hypothetical protein